VQNPDILVIGLSSVILCASDVIIHSIVLSVRVCVTGLLHTSLYFARVVSELGV